jgi:hypothetical protein
MLLIKRRYTSDSAKMIDMCLRVEIRARKTVFSEGDNPERCQF